MFIDKSGELFFIPIIIGALIGAYSGYKIGEARGATGWNMVGYIFGGAAIGALSGSAALGVSVAGGGAMLAGAAAGAIGGAGFSGLATGWNGQAMLKGAVFGAISGFVGGGIAASIGGGLGAFAGGVSSDLTSQLLNGNSINIGSSLIAGGVSFGLYHGMSYLSYKQAIANKQLPSRVTYNQYAKMNTAYQKSRFWHREYVVYLNGDGTARIFKGNKFDVTFDNWKQGDWTTAHTHWARDGKNYIYNGEQVTAVGGYHSPHDLANIPNFSLVIGRTSSTYSLGNGKYNFINPDPFQRFFLFPFLRE
jgi:hypothetical protein